MGRLFARLATLPGLAPRSAARRHLGEARRLRRALREDLAAHRQAMRALGARLDRRLERLAVASAHNRDAIARLDARARDNRAAFETFAAAFAAPHASDQFGDARTEMERLRRRLDLRPDDAAGEYVAEVGEIPTSRRGAL
jgi:hypothetical protein